MPCRISRALRVRSSAAARSSRISRRQDRVLARQPHELRRRLHDRQRRARRRPRRPSDDVNGALVVERTRREVGPQHHATLPRHARRSRSRSSTPTGAASASSSPGLALMRSRIVAATARRRRARHGRRRAPRCRGAGAPPVRRRHRRAGEHDAREPAAAEPILVIHRGLVDEVGQLALGAERAIAEERRDRRRERRPASRSRCPTCTSSQSPPRRAGRGQLRVDQAEAGDVDQSRRARRPSSHARSKL